MSGVGAIRSLALGNRKWRIPSDIDLTFWAGGRHNAEWLDDNQGGTPSSKNTTGKITGLNLRMAKDGDLAAIITVCKNTVDNNTPCTVELANGEKWSAPVKAVIDEGGPLTSAEGKYAIDLYADNDIGEFVQI
jgi:hypothetical protein